MQRTKIKAGVVYASKSASGSPSPVMFLEDGAAGIYSRQRDRSVRQHAESAHTKAHKGSDWGDETIGYAIVQQDWSTSGTDPAPLPWTIDPAVELERFRAGGTPSVPGLRFAIVTSLSKITPWDAAVAENEAREAAEEERRAQQDRSGARIEAVKDGLRAFGVDVGYSFGSAEIKLAVWEAEKLLALLRDREA